MLMERGQGKADDGQILIRQHVYGRLLVSMWEHGDVLGGEGVTSWEGEGPSL